ncbi:transporter Avl9 [Drepanopeziza brunnea f. sp. 'multigermtubi' MB_m1]|uniref:Transporter Avl9 n=1 Tax=Marssonina brunnea f. sp. multigermtubi (strain MB_m1) TaxID=1072389 RepID=K1X143_MARBU|nr:transporter Avl9 [Drepanopeziza brunnea f. sp. 'multigermtubi' MB_m1]EKD18707.1 transporter Avl9 [Drepanopeziza brunnea f. sp. 'multigermtubi' MB_m1]
MSELGKDEDEMERIDLDTAPVPVLELIPISATPATNAKGNRNGSGFVPLVTVVDFHHARGPEVESWFGVPEGVDPAVENEWPLLPFMALSDGAHASTEDFSYFTLLRPAHPDSNLPATSLFGISCTRQLDSSSLLNRPADVTRSTVQKAVVVIADTPQFFGMLRERLSVVTTAWFAQREFTDTEILKRFQESLQDEKERGVGAGEEDREEYLGMSLRELVREFRWQTLVLFKCCLLQPKGSLFGPYTPLQQLDILADYGTKSYIVGSTNSLLLQQKDRYSDILINLDSSTINISSSSLRSALALSVADRRWIDFITQSVNDTWDGANPGRPKTMGYVGSEEFIRLQFEEYLLSLISAVKCHNYMQNHAHNPKAHLPQVQGDPSHDFGADWIEAWSRSENYRIWDRYTDSHLFDVVEPKHPCAGGLTIEDVQRRMMEQVKEYHLDERFATGKEVLGRNLQAGKEKASTVFNKLYADMEALREAQRKKYEEAQRNGTAPQPSSPRLAAPDLNGAKQTVQSVGSKAGAYIGSWGTWVGEKRKTGWGRGPSTTASAHIQAQNQAKENAVKEKSPLGEDDRPKTGESYEESLFDAEQHDITPRDITPRDITPRDITPRDITPRDITPRDITPKVASQPSTFRFHEEVEDDDARGDGDGGGGGGNTTAVVPPSEESQAWGEEKEDRKQRGDVDAERKERSSAVAEAVQAATQTPISP